MNHIPIPLRRLIMRPFSSSSITNQRYRLSTGWRKAFPTTGQQSAGEIFQKKKKTPAHLSITRPSERKTLAIDKTFIFPVPMVRTLNEGVIEFKKWRSSVRFVVRI